jgi:hypothetical protein
VRELGYKVPRKSACVFCPYGTKPDFQTLARELPEQFAKVVELEAAKPPTSNGIKMSIKGFQARRKRKDGSVSDPKGTPLDEYIKRPSPKRKPIPCEVCGAAQRATKAAGCDYLE